MKRFLKWTILVAAIAGIAALIYYKTRPEPVSVVVKPVVRGSVAQTVANTRSGTVKACRRARLSPSVGGQIDKLPVQEGDTVKAGQLLLEIWNEDLKAQRLLAEGEFASAEARAKAAELTAAVAEREAVRLTKLLEQGVGAESQTDKAVSQAKALRADTDAAVAAVKVAAARVAVATANIDRTRLTAPFDGIVAEINGELKEYVTPSPIGVATLPTIDIIELDCFYVTAPIDEVDAGSIGVGMPAIITMDSFRGREFEGRVRRVSDYVLELEKQARTVDVEVDFENPEDTAMLLAGYSADVEIILETRSDVLRVPTEAVLEGRRVIVFHPETGILEAREVEVGISNWLYTEVLSGLKEAERVVVNVERPGVIDGVAAVAVEASS
jgi:HlyD family secretion protein